MVQEVAATKFSGQTAVEPHAQFLKPVVALVGTAAAETATAADITPEITSLLQVSKSKQPKICGEAQTASCLACKEDKTVEKFCVTNSGVIGYLA